MNRTSSNTKLNNKSLAVPLTVEDSVSSSSSELSLTSKIVGKFPLDTAQQLHNYFKQNGTVWVESNSKEQLMDQLQS